MNAVSLGAYWTVIPFEESTLCMYSALRKPTLSGRPVHIQSPSKINRPIFISTLPQQMANLSYSMCVILVVRTIHDVSRGRSRHAAVIAQDGSREAKKRKGEITTQSSTCVAGVYHGLLVCGRALGVCSDCTFCHIAYIVSF
jgi:hypothetical protein